MLRQPEGVGIGVFGAVAILRVESGQLVGTAGDEYGRALEREVKRR